MNQFLKEDLLSKAVDPSRLKVGQSIIVMTKSGAFILTGRVIQKYSSGSIHASVDSTDKTGIYDPKLFSFCIIDEDDIDTLDEDNESVKLDFESLSTDFMAEMLSFFLKNGFKEKRVYPILLNLTNNAIQQLKE